VILWIYFFDEQGYEAVIMGATAMLPVPLLLGLTCSLIVTAGASVVISMARHQNVQQQWLVHQINSMA